MKHGSFVETCAVCRRNAESAVLFENDHWLIPAPPAGAGVPGWLVLQTQRHVAGIAHFNDAEAANFGPALRHFERVLEEVSGALRIYSAAMGESFPHFHMHMVPRSATMPKDAKGFAVFDLLRASQAKEIAFDEAEATRILDAYRDVLQRNPPPP